MPDSPLIPIFCPHCNHEFRLRGGEPTENQTIICPKCNTNLMAHPISELEELLTKCETTAKWRYLLLPSLPEKTSLSVVQLWEEVRISFILEQYAASLALVGGFIEYLLETAIEAKANTTLGKAIDQAKKKGLINKKQKDSLHVIRDMIRNRYSHGDYEEIVKYSPVSFTIEEVDILKSAAEKKLVVSEPFSELGTYLSDKGKMVKKEGSDRGYARRTLQYIYYTACELIEKSPRLQQ